MKRLVLHSLLFSCAFGGLLFDAPRSAEANILITPTRVVFEGRERFEVVTLVNTSAETQAYEMSWVFFEMQSEGKAYKSVKVPPGAVDISDNLVFSPRRVTLEAGAKQKIRLALQRPSDLPDGDYHVHLKIAQVPKVEEKAAEGELVAGLRINLSYTIPVIVRSGDVSVVAEIGDVVLGRNPNTNLLTVDVPIKRSGDYSVLGGVMVYHVDVDGKEELVGEVSNAHIFPEVDSRTISVQLNKEIVSGSLRVVLLHNNDGDEDFVYSERIFPLQ